MEAKKEIQGIRKERKYDKNPFIGNTMTINTRKKQIIVGSTKDILVNTDTGDVQAISLLHKFKEVDREQFVKIYVDEVRLLFDLSKTGLKVFGYFLKAMRINQDEVYISMSKLMEYCNYQTSKPAYKGLAELLSNKIIAMSTDPNIWFINPHIIFNGDRIAFIKEYRLKDKKPLPEQSTMELGK